MVLSSLWRSKKSDNARSAPQGADDAAPSVLQTSTRTTREIPQQLADTLDGAPGEEVVERTEYRPAAWQHAADNASTADQPAPDAPLGDPVAWREIVRKASDTEIVRELRAGAKIKESGSLGGTKSTSRGPFYGSATGNISGQIGGEATVDASASATVGPLGLALQAAAAVKFSAGAKLDADAELVARLWQLEFMATGKASLFAGFEASAAAQAYMNLKQGIGASAKAAAFAGVKGSAEASAALKLGPAELTAMAEVAGSVGAAASASASFSIGFTGIEASASAEAFVGVKASAGVSGSFGLKGKTIIAASGEISVSAGVGAKAKGSFSFKGGKLKIDLGGDFTLGAGGGIDVSTEIDLYALAEVIGSTVWETYAKYANKMDEAALAAIDRTPVSDPEVAKRVRTHGYDTYITDFRTYAAKKLKQGDNGIKEKRVQELLDARRGQLGMSLTHAEVDEGIQQAARDAFGALVGQFTTVAGKITEFSSMGGEDLKTARTSAAKEKLIGDFRTAIEADAEQQRAEGRKKRGKADFVPNPTGIDAIIAKHRPAILKTYPNDRAEDADQMISGVITAAYGGVIARVVLRDGKILAIIPDVAALHAAEAADDTMQALSKRMHGLADLRSECATYARKLLSVGTKKPDPAEVQKIVDKYAAAIAGETAGKKPGESTIAHSTTSNLIIASTISDGLGPSVKKVTYQDGKLTLVAAEPAQARTAYLAAADMVRLDALCDTAKTEFSDYLAKKTGQGERGVKLGRVQEIVDRVITQTSAELVDAASEKLEKIAGSVLAPMVSSLMIRNGRVVQFQPVPAGDVAAIKQSHADDKAAKGRYLEDSAVSERQYLIYTKVNAKLQSYRTSLISDPNLKVLASDFDALLTKNLGSRTDLFQREDARHYLEALISANLDGIVSVTINQLGRVARFEVDQSHLDTLRQAAMSDSADRRARVALIPILVPKLRPLAAKRQLPTVQEINAVIAPLAGKLASYDVTVVDAVLEEAVVEAFGSHRVRSIKFKAGQAVTPPVPARRK